MKKEASLSIVEDVKNRKFLMVRNQRGINKGFVNFPGGKREPGETMEECVKRETFEETSVVIEDPVYVGYVEFPTSEFFVHIYRSTKFSGEIQANAGETEVFWQDADKIPYSQMREADRDFLPEVLAGCFVRRRYYYADDGHLVKVENLSGDESAKNPVAEEGRVAD